jgi:hypothetical protein
VPVKFEAALNTKNLENKLRIFSSGLGGIFKELMKAVGQKMTAEAKSLAPSRTGRLKNNINFIVNNDTEFVLTTRKSLKRSNVWYSRIVEKDRHIKPKKGKYLVFKIDGEWKKVDSVNVKGQPYMSTVYDEYWEGQNSKGYRELARALENKIRNYFDEL